MDTGAEAAAASLAKLDWGFQDIVRYLRKGEYRKGLSSGQKSAIRSAIKSFCYEEKKLYYTGQKSGRKRLVVMNEEDKRSTLQRVHGADHCGQTRTRKLLEEHYYWKGMVNDIRDYINACEICKQKSYKRSSISHVKLLKASYPWEVLGMDLLGPFPATSRAHCFVLLIVDYFTKWAELTPMTGQSAAHVVAALATAFHRFGFPKKLFCNVSEEYVAQINEEMFRHFPMCSGLAISHLWASGAHKATSQVLRDCVSKATGRHRDWELQLEQRLFEYHTSKHSATRYSPFYLMLGREARLPEEPGVDGLAEAGHRLEPTLPTAKEIHNQAEISLQNNILSRAIGVLHTLYRRDLVAKAYVLNRNPVPLVRRLALTVAQ